MNRYRRFLLLACVVWIVTGWGRTLQAQNVITTWNGVASNTIVKTAGNGPSPSGVYFAYAAIATYDAVNAIDRSAQPFYYDKRAWPHASQQAAAAAAAHRVLLNYFPHQQIALDQSFMATLGGISDSQEEKDAGIAVGEAAAETLIAIRADDGLGANVTYTPGTGSGAWQPTPPGFLPPATPWLGQMRPFTMKNASQFLPDGPTPLDSPEWERDYNVTRVLGAKNGSVRTPKLTEIGIFWTENTAQQYARLFNNLATQYQLSLPETARLMAMLWTGFADAGIGCFNAKYHYGFWRPVTAIPAGGGDPDLSSDAAWLPLGTTPNHPEYPAAHACLSGAVTTLIADYFHTSNVPVMMDSLAFSPAHQHTFANTDDWLAEVQWARIYAGFHHYHSVVDGADLGKKVAHQLARNYFRPRSEGKRD
jgi:hypothetical protein